MNYLNNSVIYLFYELSGMSKYSSEWVKMTEKMNADEESLLHYFMLYRYTFFFWKMTVHYVVHELSWQMSCSIYPIIIVYVTIVVEVHIVFSKLNGSYFLVGRLKQSSKVVGVRIYCYCYFLLITDQYHITFFEAFSLCSLLYTCIVL